MKMNIQKRRRKGFTLVELLVVIAIIAALAGLATPVILKAQKAAAITEATNNARQVGTLLFMFDQDYGSFPGPGTKEAVDANSGRTAPSGSDANAYLAQLIIGGYTDSEEIFFAKVAGSKKPDGDSSDANVLAAGEVGFGYVMLSGPAPLSTTYNGNIPVLCAPVTTAAGVFDRNPYDGKAVYLRLDTSVQQKQINADGEVIAAGSKTLFETGSGTPWGTGLTPTVVLPTFN